MFRIIIVTINVIIIISLYFLNIWYGNESIKISKINEKYIRDIRRLKKIIKIDKWLKENIKKDIATLPIDNNAANRDLIRFFDMYAKEYNFKISNFIYKNNRAFFLKIEFKIPRKDIDKLENFVKLRYKDGLKTFSKFSIIRNFIKGELILIQPINVEEIVPKTAPKVDNVPQ